MALISKCKNQGTKLGILHFGQCDNKLSLKFNKDSEKRVEWFLKSVHLCE